MSSSSMSSVGSLFDHVSSSSEVIVREHTSGISIVIKHLPTTGEPGILPWKA